MKQMVRIEPNRLRELEILLLEFYEEDNFAREIKNDIRFGNYDAEEIRHVMYALNNLGHIRNSNGVMTSGAAYQRTLKGTKYYQQLIELQPS